MTSDAEELATMTCSVKIDGNAEPVEGQGTGIRSTFVPIVVVMVEHAVTVPRG